MLTNLDKKWENQHLQSPSISQHLPTAPATVLPTAAGWETTWVSLHHISRPPRGSVGAKKKDQENPKKLKIIQRHLQSSLIPFALSVCIQIIYFYYSDSTLKHNYTSLKPISTSKIKHCNLKSMEIHGNPSKIPLKSRFQWKQL